MTIKKPSLVNFRHSVDSSKKERFFDFFFFFFFFFYFFISIHFHYIIY